MPMKIETKTYVYSTFHICWGAQAGLYPEPFPAIRQWKTRLVPETPAGYPAIVTPVRGQQIQTLVFILILFEAAPCRSAGR